MVGLVDEEAVEATEDLLDVVVDLHQRPQVGVGQGHDDGGTKAMSGDVADHKAHRTIGHGNIIEIISGGKLGRVCGPGDVETGQAGRGLRP